MSFIVAVDGPAGSGKGTITKKIAEQLNLVNIDTGATYRCIALQALKEEITIEQKEKIIEISNKVKIEMNENGQVFLNNENVTEEIRSKEVTAIVSQISSIKEVRVNLIKLQRELAEGKDVIMEGRDITTYVFPNADVKIYLDASVEERARRRFKQMKEKGIITTYNEVLESIKVRDENDKNKEIGSLKIAEDAVVVDATNLTIEEVVEKVKNIILEKRG